MLCFTGGYLHDPADFTMRGNVVYEMIDKNALDGLIIWTSSLSSYVGLASIEKFCARYRPLPMVSIGVVLEGIPSILLDSYRGMRELMSHLITAHQRRRLVFIRGPEGHRDAQERYRAYFDVLREYDLPIVPELVSPPYKWFDPGGAQMTRALLDQRIDFDAIIGVNDVAAVTAMEVLHAREIRVPEDVSVVGFDNTPLSRVVTPLLTTAPWRMYERGRQAANLMLAMLDGKSVPDQVLVPTRLIVRQSCGCQDPAVVQASIESPALTYKPSDRAQCLSALEQAVEEKERPPESLVQFLDAFLAEVEGETPGIFLPTLEKVLRQVVALRGDITAWQTAVSVLRQQLLPARWNDPRKIMRAEDLWHQARVIISETARRAIAYQEWQARQQTLHLRRIHQELTTTSVPGLMDVLAQELP
ncbi:MAG: substrate-binding domain-containing protein, partial [Anaerolineales bacterium]|nr:substrate-binding domain-containing protein [Anaerolineales bacterium]